MCESTFTSRLSSIDCDRSNYFATPSPFHPLTLTLGRVEVVLRHEGGAEVVARERHPVGLHITWRESALLGDALVDVRLEDVVSELDSFIRTEWGVYPTHLERQVGMPVSITVVVTVKCRWLDQWWKFVPEYTRKTTNIEFEDVTWKLARVTSGLNHFRHFRSISVKGTSGLTTSVTSGLFGHFRFKPLWPFPD